MSLESKMREIERALYDMTGEHHTVVREDLLSFALWPWKRATCDCGYSGFYRRFWGRAYKDANRHIKVAQTGAQGRKGHE